MISNPGKSRKAIKSLLYASGVPPFELIVSVFMSFLALGMTFFYLVARIGFPKAYNEIFGTLGLTLFLLLTPAIILNFWKREEDTSNPIGRVALITFATLALLVLSSFLISLIGIWLTDLFIIAGYLFLVIVIISFFKTQTILQCLLVIGGATLLCIWLFGRVYSSYHNPLAFENLTIGRATYDTFYHASIMQMIKTYGVASTGLNGTPYLPYHWGSHFLLARFAVLLDLSALTAYNLVYPIIFFSLFFKCILTFAYDLLLFFSKTFRDLKPGATFWITFMAVHIGFLPYSFMANWAVWEQWIESESYLTGLVFFFLFGSLLLYAFSRETERARSISFLFVVAILMPILGLLKISLLVTGVSVCVYVFIKLQLYRKWTHVAIITAGLLASAFALKVTSSTYVGNEENDNFYLFHFLKHFTLAGWKGFFYYIHYFFTILYIYLRFRDLQINSKNWWSYFRTSKTLDIEILIIVSVIGLLPGTLFRIDGGSAYYFTDIQTRVSVSFLLFYLLRNQAQSNAFSFLINRIALLVPALIVMIASNIFYQMERAINLNFSSRIEFSKLYSGEKAYLKATTSPDILAYLSGKKSEVIGKLKELKAVPYYGLGEDKKFDFFSRLNALDTLSVSEKRSLQIYVPRTNTFYWNDLTGNKNLTSWFIPTLTGISSVSGLPEQMDPYNYLNYGFHAYKDYVNFVYTPTPRDSICGHPQISVDKKLLIIENENKVDTLNCQQP